MGQGKWHKKLRIAAVLLLVILAVLAGGFFWYISDYYRAEDAAVDVLAQGDGALPYRII